MPNPQRLVARQLHAGSAPVYKICARSYYADAALSRVAAALYHDPPDNPHLIVLFLPHPENADLRFTTALICGCTVLERLLCLESKESIAFV